ncbi:MAG: hypothetical protein FJW23_11165 [Acidimicrobiia bacterium]|nr:hypothetical protein [Acidimicrobiia bacterium]
MKAWERWTFGMLALVVAVTGGAYLWMKYVLVSPDPFAVVNHPWEPAMLHLHVLASPALLLVFGIILNSHIMKKLGQGQRTNRATGLVSLGTFVLMTASGYLLQVATSEAWLRGLVVVHVASGTVFSVCYVSHLVISVRLSRPRRWFIARRVA